MNINILLYYIYLTALVVSHFEDLDCASAFQSMNHEILKGVLEGVPSQKGDSILSISNAMTQSMTILVKGFIHLL